MSHSENIYSRSNRLSYGIHRLQGQGGERELIRSHRVFALSMSILAIYQTRNRLPELEQLRQKNGLIKAREYTPKRSRNNYYIKEKKNF
jgi:hypothetical protein